MAVPGQSSDLPSTPGAFGPASPATIHRAADRPATRLSWLDARHSFAFGDHYDPANTHHGLLTAHNEDVVAPGHGYQTHPHSNIEIVTWVLEGTLVHGDSLGGGGEVYPGLVQRMSAGRGIEHSEVNGVRDTETSASLRFVQMWVLPDEIGGAPSYGQRELDAAEYANRWAIVASGTPEHRADAAVTLGSAHATLWVARLEAGRRLRLPAARFGHLFVAAGAVRADAADGSATLGRSDALRITDGVGEGITALVPSEVLFWQMDRSMREQLLGDR